MQAEWSDLRHAAIAAVCGCLALDDALIEATAAGEEGARRVQAGIALLLAQHGWQIPAVWTFTPLLADGFFDMNTPSPSCVQRYIEVPLE